MNAREVAVVLLCFAGKKAASTHQDPLQEGLRSAGDTVLQTTILQVDAKQKASVHDPRRVVMGTLTAALTWGLFGLIAGTNKLESTVIWAALGAICGGLYAYATEHVLTKDELSRIGRSLAPDSSALVMYTETDDPARALAAAATYTPTTASIAAIDADLVPRVFAGTSPVEIPAGRSSGAPMVEATTGLSMLLVRYPEPKTAAQVAKSASKGGVAPQIELVIETDRNGHRRVTDPTRGTAAWARSDVVSWGLFGVVFGAIAGAVGGGGLHGVVTDAVVTGVAWAVFGLVAGALYGLWAGRSISARRLKAIGPILAPGTSAVLAWADGPVREASLGELERPQAKRLILAFNPVPGGAVLEAP